MAERRVLTLKATRGYCIGGGRDVVAGDLLQVPGDLTPADAQRYINIGFAEIVESGGEPADEHREPATAPGEVEDRDPDPEDRDPTPAPKRKRPRPKK
jgi:hypothetical protein